MEALLDQVKNCGWYWGPLSKELAERLLLPEPPGSFVVRDSSDPRYIFSLSFKHHKDVIRHVRIDHDHGNFSFAPPSASSSAFKANNIVEFVESALEHSRSGRYLFFWHQKGAGRTPLRLRLVHPVSRFRQVGTLQHLCRICHCDVAEGNPESNLIAPCYCSGSLRFVHPECLQLWIKASDIKSCELCHFAFIMHTKTKPFSQWDRLDMSTLERRKVLCSVTFHVVAITCVVWSLYVLIDRTAEEARANHLEWSFWTKLIVVAVGFTGGVVFMYVQCKTYVQLFKKWRAFNRVICVQNAPEKVKPPPPAPAPAIERSTAMIVDEKVRAGSTTPPPPVTHVSVAVISDPPPATDDDLEAAPVDVHARNSDNDNDDDGDGDGDGDEHEQQAPLVIAPLDVSPV